MNLKTPTQLEDPAPPAGPEWSSSPRLQRLFNRRTGRKWPASLAAAAFPALLGLCFLTLPFLQGPVNYSYDLPFYFRKSVPVNDVVVLYMDEHSEQVLGEGRWDKWDRAEHARLIRKLTGVGVKAVVFDVVFGEDNNVVANHELAAAARENGKVVVAAINGFRVHAGEVIGSEIIKPFDELAAVTTWGMSEASDASKAVREHYRDTVFQIPSLAWRTAELIRGKMNGDPFAQRWINFYGPPGYLRHLSYADVFEKDFDVVAAFSNKVVFVGALWSVGFTGGKGTDDFRTPHTLWTGRKAPGVEVNATAYLNLTRGDALSRLPPFVEVFLVMLLGAAAGLYFVSLRPLTAARMGILLAFCIAAAGIISVLTTQIWFPWLIPVIVQLPCAVGWAVIVHTRRMQREMNLLEQEVALAGGANPSAAKFPDLAGAGPRLASPNAAQSAPARTVILPQPDEGSPRVPNYELIRIIGKGSYGEVWLARDIIGSYHAVKIVHRRAFQDAEPYEREFRGVRHFTPISRTHPGFVHILHVGRSERDDYFYYVMEIGDDGTQGQQINPDAYVSKTLRRELCRRKRLPLPECLDIAMHLADTLQHLHEHKLIHRDIKPANIIFVKGIAKFADIGLVTDAATAGAVVTYLGTKGFIAPEGPGTPMADIFSLGMLIYEIGFGLSVAQYPELPTDMVEGPDTNPLFELNRIVVKACDDKPMKRFQTATELHGSLAALRQQLTAEPLT